MEGMVENFAEMMSVSLGLSEPWYVERAKFDSEEMAVRIYVGVRKSDEKYKSKAAMIERSEDISKPNRQGRL